MTRTLTIGNVKVHLLSAGWYLADAGALHGLIPKTLWSRYEPTDEENQVRFELRSLLIESGGLRILVDNGYGDKLPEKTQQNLGLRDSPGLADSMATVGLGVEDIDLMVDTHLHGDHCGGNTTLRNGTPVPTFPKARYIIRRGEYDVACQPNERTRATYLPENYRPLVDAGVADLVDSDINVTPEVRLELAPGHTADHCIVRIASGGQTALFLADVAQRPVQVERLAWIAAFDVLPLVSLETKRRLFTEAAEHGHLLILQHHDGVGRLAARPDGGYQFTPVEDEVTR